jgi:MFS transporter, ACS family, glucarate transporter
MKKPSASQVVLIMLCLMYAITYMDRVNVSTAADGFARELHFSKTEIGEVFSAFAYPYLIFQVIGGWVSDRFGARRTLLACSFLWAIATILTGFAGGLVTMLAARVLLGLGEGATFPASTAAMARWFSPARRGFAQGITHAAARIGNAITPAAVVLIMGTYGWRASFFVLGGFSLVWVSVWALTFHEDPRQHPRITPGEIAVLAPLQSIRHKTPWLELARRMMPVTMVYFCYGWTLWLFLAWIPQYFLHSYSLDLKKSALFSGAVFFAGVAGDTLGGLITDRLLIRTERLTLARSAMVSICMFMALVSLLPLLFVHQLLVSVVCLSAGFFFAEMTIGPMWAVPMDIAPRFSGTASGMMNTGSALAAIISPVVGGWLIDTTGNWDVPFIGSMILMAVGSILALRMRVAVPFTPAASAAV